MAYSIVNFKTKKDLRLAISGGRKIGCYSPGIGPDYSHHTGSVTLEGPHFPEPHKWYAQVELVNGVITNVK